MKTGNIGKKNVVQAQSHEHPVEEAKQHGDPAKQLPAMKDQSPAEARDDEELSVAPELRSDAQLRELMSAWSRASDDVRQRFLTNIGASLSSQIKADAGLSGSEPFEIWKGLKGDVQYYGRQWVEAGCPTEYNSFERPPTTEKLVPFRRAVKAATVPEREQFLKLAQRHRR